jgi:hypothetical protein
MRRNTLAITAGALLACLVVLGSACTPDGSDEDSRPPETTETTTGAATDTVATDDAPAAARIDDDCPPVDEPSLDIPPVWPGSPLETVVGGPPLEIDLSEAIAAPCLTIASTYAAAMDVPTPSLGTIAVLEGTRVAYDPHPLPTDPDAPDEPWWGQDRVRVCANLGNGRLGCTNLDIAVWRADVVDLADRLGTDSRPKLMSPLSRGGSNDNGTSPSGLARLQDAYAATWALSQVTQALATTTAPPAVTTACDEAGQDLEALWNRARQLLDEFAPLVDVTSVELTATMGQEPPEDLAVTANTAMAAAGRWATCQLS